MVLWRSARVRQAASAAASGAPGRLDRGPGLLCRRARVPAAASAARAQVKRRWDDDVVFTNQTRGEPKAQNTMINDTIRNDFHRRFLNRYVK
jgi:protein CWC15